MDTQEPLADTNFSLEPVVEEEITQEEEEMDNIHEPIVNTIVTQEPAVDTKVGPWKNDEHMHVDITVATQEPAVKMEADQEGKEIVTKSTGEDSITEELVVEVG